MNRINELFSRKSGDILSIYFTAGFPSLEDTVPILQALQQSGVDLVEIGMPYSDPVADGPTIQESNQTALNNGMTIRNLFSQLEGIRTNIDLPIVLMGYLNPIMQYGIEDFCQMCSHIGIDGLIIPDLPMYEYITQYKKIFDQHQLRNTFLITPQTAKERIRIIDQNTEGFIYMVSSASITGAKRSINKDQTQYFERINQMGLSNPRLIGFGISNHETFHKACQYANGAIIGSAFIKLLSNSKNLNADIKNFIYSIRNSG